MGKLVDHFACDENRGVKRLFRDINADKPIFIHTFAVFKLRERLRAGL
jgi:hypothetical protein